MARMVPNKRSIGQGRKMSLCNLERSNNEGKSKYLRLAINFFFFNLVSKNKSSEMPGRA